jgi:hypothetical protein
MCTSAPLILIVLINAWGWQAAARGVGATFVGIAAAVAMLTRREPRVLRAERHGRSSGRWSAFLRRPDTWICGLTVSLPILTNSGFYFHFESIARELGISSVGVAWLFFPISFVTVALSLIGSRRVAHTPIGTTMLLLLIDQFLYVLVFSHLHSAWGAVCYVVLGSLGWALFGFLISTSWQRLHGAEILDIAVGFSLSLTLILNATSPLLFALGQTAIGSYRTVFWGLDAFILCLTLVIVVGRRQRVLFIR